MSEFLFLYRGGDSMGSPADIQKTMHKWMSWFEELGAKGLLKDGGNPLESSGKIVRKKTEITDGPFTESKDIIGGYTLIEAKDIAHAAELAGGCPIFEKGGLVEVRPILKMDM